MSEELKPCPFCGNEEINTDCIEIPGSEIKEKYLYYTRCSDCSAATTGAISEKNANRMWNTRPIEDALKSENEKLIGLLKKCNPKLTPIDALWVFELTKEKALKGEQND